jgi:hypothetical protein
MSWATTTTLIVDRCPAVGFTWQQRRDRPRVHPGSAAKGPQALRMRPTACNARRAGLRIASATESGRSLRTERHADVTARSNPVGADDCAVLIDRFPPWSQTYL